MEPWIDHRWVAKPSTRTERKWLMNVRENKHTVMLFDKKYYDIDTGKFSTDKLPTLFSESLSDLLSSDYREDYSRHHSDSLYGHNRDVSEAWFVPKDNDFDEECAREDRNRKEREQRERREWAAKEEELQRQRETYLAAQEATRLRLDRELEESKARSLAYERQLAEVEARIKAQQQVRARIAHEQQFGTSVCNVRPNRWVVK